MTPEAMHDATAMATQAIAGFESFRAHAYQDTGGVWTIGYGHTHDVKEGDVISKEDATRLLHVEVDAFAAGVFRLVKAPLTVRQAAALISFAYNVGLAAFAKSTLLRKVNAGDLEGARAEFGKWVHDEGKVVAGLVNRREAEAKLFA